jgi:integrase
VSSNGRAGTIYKKCRGCGRKVQDRRCDHCQSTSYSWAFVIDIAPPGSPRKQRSRGGFDTKGEAEDELSKLKGEVSSGTYVEPSKLTTGDYLHDMFLPAVKGDVRPSTWTDYEVSVRCYLAPRDRDGRWRGLPYLGSVPLQTLTRPAIRALYAHLREHGAVRGRRGPDGEVHHRLSAKTVHNAHIALSRALQDAIADGLLVRNPASADGSRRAAHTLPQRTPPESWDPAELAAFLAAAGDHRLHPLFHLAAHTGMRRGELCGLCWRAIDLDTRTVTITRQLLKADGGGVELVEYAKSDRSLRTIDIDPKTVRVLHNHRTTYLEERAALGLGKPSRDDLIFTGEAGQPLYPDTVGQTFDRIVTRLPVKRLTVHGLRHTHATILLKAGIPLHVVSRRLGHASEAFTAQTYAASLPQDQAEAADRFAQVIAGSQG